MTDRGRVAIVGVGYSTVGRRTGLTERELMAQAGVAALSDAGLEPSAIDGVSTMGAEALDGAWMLGMTPVRWLSNAGRAPAFVYPALQSIAAIRAGFCDTCIAFRVITQRLATRQQRAPAPDVHVGDDQQFMAPFGCIAGGHWAGLFMQRYMAEYGATEEDFGAFAVAQREWASLNDDALLRDRIDVDDYLNSRYVSQPLRLLDCDYPCDAGSAVIFTTEERARDLRQKPVFVESFGMSGVHDMTFELLQDMVHTAPTQCADDLWSRTDITASDVDCAQLYDGFSIITFQWLEALGFCGPGKQARLSRMATRVWEEASR